MAKNITYESELNFLFKILDYNKLPYHIGSIVEDFGSEIDLGLRKEIGLFDNLDALRKIYKKHIKGNSLIYITDELYCRYLFLLLPQTKPEECLTIGPYITTADLEKISTLLDNTDIAPAWASILRNFYLKVCCLPNEDALNAMLYAFGDSAWGEENYTITYYAHGVPDFVLGLSTPPDSQHRLDLLSNMDLVENFYSDENALMHAISHGQTARAKNILSNIPLLNFKQQAEPMQNLKTFTIILNTLFRKGAEQGGVHPVYVDQLSSHILQRITDLTRSDNILDLWNDMIQKYCSLVNNHSTQNFSLPIQKVIIKINLDLSADLSLKALAEYLNVNASYLSKLFHKETGNTLTNYVNKKRMDYATYLLSNTTLPISVIAQHCGILDDNYFTKLFKRHYDITPTQFRESVGKHYN